MPDNVRSKQLTGLSEDVESEYDDLRQEVEAALVTLAHAYLSGALSAAEFIDQIRSRLRDYYLDIAFLVRDDLTQAEIDNIAQLLAVQGAYLDGFLDDLESDEPPSDSLILWRAGIYSFAWDVLIRFNTPGTAWAVLPAWPGIDCLGGAACGCQWMWEEFGDEMYFYWVVNPLKDHCTVCLENESQYNPYIITTSDIL